MKPSKTSSLVLSVLCILAVGGQRTYALASGAAALADHSAAAVNLFNNMRVPAALIAGSLVPIGILSAPQIDEKKDSKVAKLAKKANILLAGISLLNEILAVTYSSIAINKLVEITAPQTAGVSELIAQTHLLAWVGTNVHFLLGLMGFALVVGAKAYFGGFGDKVGRAAMGWSVAVFLQAVAVINRGIAMGGMDETARFASNLCSLVWKYVSLLLKNAKGGIFATAAVVAAMYSMVATVQALLPSESDN